MLKILSGMCENWIDCFRVYFNEKKNIVQKRKNQNEKFSLNEDLFFTKNKDLLWE